MLAFRERERDREGGETQRGERETEERGREKRERGRSALQGSFLQCGPKRSVSVFAGPGESVKEMATIQGSVEGKDHFQQVKVDTFLVGPLPQCRYQ